MNFERGSTIKLCVCVRANKFIKIYAGRFQLSLRFVCVFPNKQKNVKENRETFPRKYFFEKYILIYDRDI